MRSAPLARAPGFRACGRRAPAPPAVLPSSGWQPARTRAWLATALVALAAACGEQTVRYDREPFATDPPAIGSLRGRILTTNSGDDSLSVIDPTGTGDPATPLRSSRMPVGFVPVEIEGPHHATVDPQGRFVYVNLSLPNAAAVSAGPHGSHGQADVRGWVLKLDTTDGRELARARVEANPGDAAISADGNTVFVTHYDLARWRMGRGGPASDSNLVAVDARTMTVAWVLPLCPAAHGVRLSADGTRLFATCGPDQLAIVDLSDPARPVRRVQLPGTLATTSCSKCPYALSVAPDGLVWVSSLGPSGGSMGRGGIDVFDPTAPGGGAFDPARSISVAGSALFASFVPDASGGYRVLVPEQGAAGDFLRLHSAGSPGQPPVAQDALPLTPDVCLNAHMSIVAPGHASAWLVCEGDHKGPGTFVAVGLAPLMVQSMVPVGVFPDGLVLVP